MIHRIATTVALLLLVAANSAFAGGLTTVTVRAGGDLRTGDVLAGPLFNGSILYVKPIGVTGDFEVDLVGADIPDADTDVSAQGTTFATIDADDNYIRQRFVTNSIGTYLVVAADSVQPSNARITILFVQGGGGSASAGSAFPERVIVYGDSISAETSLVQVDDCDWCDPLNEAGTQILNVANNGARVSTQDDSLCNAGDGYTNCYNGPEQVAHHPTSGVCQRGTVATPINLYGDPSTDELTCAEDLGLTASDTTVILLGINDVMQGSPAGFHVGAPNSFYDHMIEDFQVMMDAIYYKTPASCVVGLMPPQWRGETGNAVAYVQRNANLREYQEDILPIIGAKYPRCEVVDLYQAFLDVETNDGEAAMLGLYRNITGLDASECPAKGGIFPPADCLHPNVAGSLFMGELITDAIRNAHRKNLPGTVFAHDSMRNDVWDVNPLAQGSLKSLDGLVYDAGTDSLQNVSSDLVGSAVVRGVNLPSADQACVVGLDGGPGDDLRSGCVWRQSKDNTGPVPLVLVSGTGFWDLYSYEGGAVGSLLDSYETSGGDLGNLGPDDCVAQTITGIGTSTVIRSWPVDCTSVLGGIKNDPAEWPTCHGSLYGTTAVNPGCTSANVEVDFSAFITAPGTGVGFAVEETTVSGTQGVVGFWASEAP